VIDYSTWLLAGVGSSDIAYYWVLVSQSWCHRGAFASSPDDPAAAIAAKRLLGRAATAISGVHGEVAISTGHAALRFTTSSSLALD
jgi:hypothetical protein